LVRLIDYILQIEIKTSELKILKFISERENVKISQLKDVSNWYQIKEIIPKFKKMGFITQDEIIKINYDNDLIKILFKEI
jgi:hypothetical protein